MPVVDKSLLVKLLRLALRPVVRFCLRHSIKLQDFVACAKAEFYEAAAHELKTKGHKGNISRLSVMTGLHRRELMQFQKGIPVPESDRDLVTRVIGQWRTDGNFLTKSGDPRVLTAGTEDSEFTELCRSVSNDINPGTILFELERVNAIAPAKGGIRLMHESYVPAGDPLAGFSIYSDDADSLLETVEENVLSEAELPQFHARTSYDNVRPDALDQIKRWFLKEGHEFHARVRKFVGQFDQDINPDAKFKGTGIKVVFGSFGNSRKKGKGDER